MSTGLTARLSARVGALQLEAELETRDGTLVLIGPNGAGKTSLFSLVLGVLPAQRAQIQVGDTVLVDSERVFELPVEARRIGYVPQDYALFPHLSVRANVAFAVQSAGARGPLARERVDKALHALGLSALAEHDPRTLSGGEKQRVALARALGAEPRALLLDEPLAALDVHARREVREFLVATLARISLPTMIITHDPADARALGQRIAVIEAGKITQLGSWAELAAQPATHFVAEFVAAGALG
ncbi:MAG TPA: ABC transporter ATP-binding protein [Polyangiales bacterium]|nr:ABC transporter ATP-binding protein [Polyangiales bacterium]